MNIEHELARLAVPAPESLADEVIARLGPGYDFVTSPLGDLVVVFTDHGVIEIGLASGLEGVLERHDARHGVRPVPGEMPELMRRRVVRAVERGTPGDLEVDLSGLTEFQRAVLLKTAEIPRGEVRPYGWVAREIGRPGATRAVGSALASNPVPVVIPCHRVVRSDGDLGNYSLGEAANKERLLSHEGMDVDEFERLSEAGVRYVGSDTTKIFCHPTCRNARRITDAHRVEFDGERAAERGGFRPCKVCRPAVLAS